LLAKALDEGGPQGKNRYYDMGETFMIKIMIIMGINHDSISAKWWSVM